ncbi:alpha/beta fold hydrolase [Leptospira borgpetersenii]|uniref:alpha/beta fold hydrolase n=1 Tax=Leptospira borgpetersenii TaxID=174 RepID=UPI000772F5FA|nr:alpha/beta hydrolase [Leptospira borgpetersenii]MBE8362847.1 alpha/beta fold hydrolase [Leptospira borgpetersenii serovar Balcanica]MBE8366340.1 alpha/beta fold hydrolase [Leptospira borgpetersenii serovar Balcanica]MBE8399010.1 alpha/beta fold hydrolase [Leptospira borgpetersenii serovar Tarassovi]MBE8402094.1 alpha/beta fold hydrolase [Leptospira borgpetersenii serovar Tarassovi]MBE8405109.1 alpha/beta fold hydrolase [Leptospira borgpetersenii serovar Tarassovi]
MSLTSGIFFFTSMWLFLSGISCSIPEDLKKEPEESLIRLKGAGAELREFYLDAEGKRIYGVAVGCKSNNHNILIFIHGSPGGWQNYSWYLGNEVLTAKYCILALDRPGFGKSEPKEGIPDVEKQAYILGKAIRNFLNAIQISEEARILLVGHSYGGPIAARIVMTSTYKVHVLILLAAPLSSKEEEIRWYNKIADWNWVKILLPIEIKNSNDEMLPLKSQLEVLEKFWKNISCRTILIHGKKDSLVPFQNLEFFKTQVPQSQLTTIVLETEGHFIPWTQRKFLESIFLEAVR